MSLSLFAGTAGEEAFVVGARAYLPWQPVGSLSPGRSELLGRCRWAVAHRGSQDGDPAIGERHRSG
ncbi:hypothetical protein AB0L41_00370 [Amycolatopsis mediterranei]|uniref:hypothetical protein n=1 Tax=Amycolatopsis mediterranei TaxID=33910 RepID=UPI00343B7EBB